MIKIVLLTIDFNRRINRDVLMVLWNVDLAISVNEDFETLPDKA
ncbi:MAG: hypothetical protein ACTS4V_01160 [Candidatus Hodgkinia cicadicola]